MTAREYLLVTWLQKPNLMLGNSIEKFQSNSVQYAGKAKKNTDKDYRLHLNKTLFIK